MSCLSVNISREGGASSSASIIATHYVPTLVRVGGNEANATRKGGIRCNAWQVCKTGIKGKLYLEIAPMVVWVLAGWTSNDVYSNTNWNIN